MICEPRVVLRPFTWLCIYLWWMISNWFNGLYVILYTNGEYRIVVTSFPLLLSLLVFGVWQCYWGKLTSDWISWATFRHLYEHDYITVSPDLSFSSLCRGLYVSAILSQAHVQAEAIVSALHELLPSINRCIQAISTNTKHITCAMNCQFSQWNLMCWQGLVRKFTTI